MRLNNAFSPLLFKTVVHETTRNHTIVRWMTEINFHNVQRRSRAQEPGFRRTPRVPTHSVQIHRLSVSLPPATYDRLCFPVARTQLTYLRTKAPTINTPMTVCR